MTFEKIAVPIHQLQKRKSLIKLSDKIIESDAVHFGEVSKVT